MVDNQKILDAALAIRSARAVDEHLAAIGNANVQRLALEQETLRDAVMAGAVAQREVAEKLEILIDVMRQLLTTPPVVNVEAPQALPALPAPQAVTVTVPKDAVEVKPVINVPATKVIIQKPERTIPRYVTITHSDGSMSTLDFGK